MRSAVCLSFERPTKFELLYFSVNLSLFVTVIHLPSTDSLFDLTETVPNHSSEIQP
jgi:hypothetical protein